MQPPPSPEFCLFFIDWWPMCMTKGEWASWAQAIGSILAVAAAIGVVAWQLHRERARTKKTEISRLQQLWTLAYHSRVEMQYISEHCGEGEMPLGPGSLGAKVAALREVPVLDIPDAQAAIAVLTVIEAYETFLVGTAPQPIGNTDVNFPRGGRIQSYSTACLLNFEFAEQRIRLSLEDRKGELPIGSEYSMNKVPFPPLPPG